MVDIATRNQVLMKFVNTEAERPVRGLVNGDLAYTVDTGKFWLWSGTAWIQISPAGNLSDGDKGDITVTASGSTWTIDPDAVTYAKMQNISAASRLLGRGSAAGAGDVEEITLGAGLTMSGVTLSAAGGSTPTGTGFRHVTAGVEDAAAKLVDTADVNVDQITNPLLADVAPSTIKGRAVGAGTGDPTDLTPAQVIAVLEIDPPRGSYAPGTFTVPTGKFALMAGFLALTSTESVALEGTARLIIEN